MYRGRSNLLPVIVLVVVAAVAIIGMVSLGRLLLRGGGNDQVANDAATRALLNTEADRSVSMNVRGAIVADEDFRSYEIEISPIVRRMTLYKGYSNEIIEAVRLPNSTEAYAEFVNALNLANFSDEAELPEGLGDTEGVCATGRLYTFSFLQAQSVTDQTWITSCRGLAGSFGGDASLARKLFEAQIPNSRELLRSIDL